MASKSLPREQVLTLLAATPTRIAALTSGITPARLQKSTDPNEWSANEVLAHLRACADVWGGCIAQIISEDGPTLRAINPLTWIKKTNYLEQDFALSLNAFTRQRADLLAMLEPLPHDGWSRTASVTGAGKVLERTVHFYANWLARHERQHVRQVEQIVTELHG